MSEQHSGSEQCSSPPYSLFLVQVTVSLFDYYNHFLSSLLFPLALIGYFQHSRVILEPLVRSCSPHPQPFNGSPSCSVLKPKSLQGPMRPCISRTPTSLQSLDLHVSPLISVAVWLLWSLYIRDALALGDCEAASVPAGSNLSLGTCIVFFLPSFRSLLRCHFLSGSLPDQPLNCSISLCLCPTLSLAFISPVVLLTISYSLHFTYWLSLPPDSFWLIF